MKFIILFSLLLRMLEIFPKKIIFKKEKEKSKNRYTQNIISKGKNKSEK